jgi:hypothetical protein
MFRSSFESKEDHKSINDGMAIFPTLAIFMSVVVEQRNKKEGIQEDKVEKHIG